MSSKLEVRRNMVGFKLNMGTVLFRNPIGGFLVAALFLFGFNTNAQVKSSIDTTLIRIGEEIKYTIEVEADSTALVLFPEGQSFKPLEVIDSYKVDTTFALAKMRLIKKYGITQYDSGRYKLPAQRVVINDKAYKTDSAIVEVRDVPVDTTKQKMFDIKPAIEVNEPPFDFIKLLYWLVPILLLAVLVFLFFRRKKRKQEREKQLPPYEEAMQALQQLDEAQLLKDNKSKDYYSSLTEIVKRYIDREVDNTALESTSDELIERLQLHKDAGNFDFDTETIKKLDGIFKRADLVKFAKMQEAIGQARADRDVIEDIINETKEAIPEPTEEELMETVAYFEKLKKRKKRRKWIIGITSIFVLAAAAMITYGSVYGYYELRDKVLGNELRDLMENRWYESEYGFPPMNITTPEVLKRDKLDYSKEFTGASAIIFDSITAARFSYNSKKMDVFVELEQILAPPNSPLEIEGVIQMSLNRADSLGYQITIVKNEKFTTPNGAEGSKTFGTATYKEGRKKISLEYAILTFTSEIASKANPEAKEKVIQRLMLFWNEDEVYSKQIAERIMKSIELVDEKQEKNQNEKEDE